MYYLAVDIGATSGRHILARLHDGKIALEEVYRFKTPLENRGGHLCWDIDQMFSDIKSGIKRCGEMGKAPSYMGIDCFGVDYVLVGKNGERVSDSVSYRDRRTAGIPDELHRLISERELFKRTGIAAQSFNTIYQLFALKKENEDALNKASRFLMLADYFSYRLTGGMKNEFTNATTTQMVNVRTREFDGEILAALGYPKGLFAPLTQPGETAGSFTGAVKAEVGFDCTVVVAPTHDTAAAVMAAPLGENSLYISSGTWSLMGVEMKEPDCSEAARQAGFTNEGGYGKTVRFLKNITGFWIAEQYRKERKIDIPFPALNALAEKSENTIGLDVNSPLLFSPESMTGAVHALLRESGFEGEEIGDVFNAIYRGMAEAYAKTAAQLEDLTGRRCDEINIIGGGSQNALVNRFTGEYTGKKITAGPVEASALGNIAAQMLAAGEFRDLKQARETITPALKDPADFSDI